MPAGSCARLSDLPEPCARVLAEARRGTLATNGPDGVPHVVPVCYAVRNGEIVVEVDEKPKRGSKLQRVRNIERDPAAAFVVDRWDEDWTRLAWVMVRGEARIEPPGSAPPELVERYEQYRTDPPRGPVIAIRPRRINWWSWS